ncbi:diaminopimelate decarboxylase family protein [Merdibacter massiliensis]|uniref:diaminopimelate decarboxylase family protein n=1 Tax=Merdibacter massiliensis TaxID=1871030 RepID=UPI00096AC1D7|nr:alanine racemase [Merdibacter massiliensis]
MIQDYQFVKNEITTPSYVFDCDILLKRIRMMRKYFTDSIHLCYAMKANPFIIEAIQDEIDHYEVCSPGEQRICERAGIDMNKVVLSGVYKAKEDVEHVMHHYLDGVIYTAESYQQFQLIHGLAKEKEICVKVLLRITSGNQFGMDENILRALIKDRSSYPYADIIGIQHFSGTQRKRLSQYALELSYLDDLIEALRKDYDYETKLLEFGPGFYVEYFQDSKPYDEEELLKGFAELLKNMRYSGEITLEIGRFLSAACGTYYTQIVDMKRNHDIDYCIVDGGMHQMNYFGQRMAMKIPFYQHLYDGKRDPKKQPYHICGSLCTVNDHLVKQLPLQEAQIGDILAFANVGAYSMSEGASLFLSRDLPKIYLYDQEKGLCLMRDRFETNILNYK